MTVHLKDPASVLDYQFDWSTYLISAEVITTSTWAVTPPGLNIDSDSNTDTAATVNVSGGTLRQIYRLTNKIVTDANRTIERSFIIRIAER